MAAKMLNDAQDMANTPRGASPFMRLARAVLCAWIFLLVLALFPFTADPATPIKMLITHIALSFVAFLCLLDALLYPPARRASGMVFAVPAALLALALCAFPLLDPLHQGMLDAARWWLALFALAGVFARAYTGTEQAVRFFQAFLLASAISSCYGFLQLLGLDPFPWGMRDVAEYRLLPATYGNPNVAGHALLIAFILSLGLAMQRRKAGYLVFTFVCGLHLYLTEMRAAWVALAAAFALALVFLLMRGVVREPLKTAAVTVGLLLFGCAVAIGGVFYVLAMRPEAIPPLENSLQLRLNGYQNAVAMLMDRPFTGVGPGRYMEETPAHWTSYEKRWFAMEERRNPHVHNEPLEFAAEFGLGGIFLYCLLFFGGLLGGLYTASRARFGEDRFMGLLLATVLAAVAVDGLLGFNLRVPVSAALTFAAFGLVVGLLSRNAPPQRAVLAPLLLTLSLGVSAWFEVRSFQAEMQYQRANAARIYADSARGNAEQFNYALDESVLSLRRAQAWKPWAPEFYKLEAMAEAMRPDYPAAHGAWMRVLKYSRHDPHALHGALDAALNAHVETQNAGTGEFLRSAEAGRLLARLENLAPEWSEYLVVAGRMADEVDGDYEAAKAFYQQALERGAKNRGILYRLLVRIEARAGNDEAIPGLCLKALKTEAQHPELWGILKQTGWPSDNVEAWLLMLHEAWLETSENPRALAAHVYLAQDLANAYAQIDGAHRQLAAGILNATLARAPGHPELLQTLHHLGRATSPAQTATEGTAEAGKATYTEADVEALAEELSAPVEDRETTMLSYLQRLAEFAAATPAEAVRREMGLQIDAAKRALETAPLGGDSQPRALGILGECFYHMAEWDGAENALKAAVPALEGGERAVRLAQLSEAQAQLGDPEAALKSAREAHSLMPEHNGMKVVLARRLAEAGDNAEALFHYMTLLRRMPQDGPDYQKVHAEYEALKNAAQKQQEAQDE